MIQPTTNPEPPRASVSVVVPVFNSDSSLQELTQRVIQVLSRLGRDYEVILVNDGSTDSSWQTIRTLALHHCRLHGINLVRNYGQHNALLCGVRAARYETVVTLDDDLQNPPEEIPILLDELSKGYDVVYGAPSQRRHGYWRNIGSNMTRLILSRLMVSAAQTVSSYRAFRTTIRDSFAHYHGPSVSLDVLLSWGAARFGAVAVRHERRLAGNSTYTLGRLFAHALDMVTGFSTLPLRIASWMGFLFTAVGLITLIYVVAQRILYGGQVPGFPFLASVISLFAGAQLFALGMIGEYLARVYSRSMNQPAYVVLEKTPNDARALTNTE